MDSHPPPANAASAGGYSEGAPRGLPAQRDGQGDVGRIDSRARNAAILGILGIFPLSIVAGIPAIILGARALQRIKVSEGAVRGRAAAWCGIALGCLSILALVVVFYRAHR
jgi:hypothetical protein